MQGDESPVLSAPHRRVSPPRVLQRQLLDMFEWLSEQMRASGGGFSPGRLPLPGHPALWGPTQVVKWISKACDCCLPVEPEGPQTLLSRPGCCGFFSGRYSFPAEGQRGSLPLRGLTQQLWLPRHAQPSD